MSNNYQIQTNSLKEKAKIYVEGNVTYSHIASHIEGEELKRDIDRKAKFNMTPIQVPYTTITVKNAKIVPQNPAALTREEQYIQERFYMKQETDPSTNQPIGSSFTYTVNSKSPYLPIVSQFNHTTKVAEQIDLDGHELDTGLKVIICLSVYKPKNFANKGIGLDSIIVMEPIRFYSGAATNYSDIGILYKPLPGDQSRVAITPVTAREGQQANNENNDGPKSVMEPSSNINAQNNTQQQAIQPPMTAVEPTPVGGQPQLQEPVNTQTIPNQTEASLGDPETPWICPKCGGTNTASQKFCGGCGTQKPSGNTINNPYVQNVNPIQPAQGIVFNPNPTDRNY